MGNSRRERERERERKIERDGFFFFTCRRAGVVGRFWQKEAEVGEREREREGEGEGEKGSGELQKKKGFIECMMQMLTSEKDWQVR